MDDLLIQEFLKKNNKEYQQKYDQFSVKKGGMGIVFHIYKTKMNQDFVVKFFNPECLKDNLENLDNNLTNEKFIQYFKNEIEILIRCRNKNIIEIYDCEEINNPTEPKNKIPYYIMEYCNEGSLKDRIVNSKEKISLESAINIICDVCEALDFMHVKGIYHRDIKPANILIRDGIVKVSDFGIAKVLPSETGKLSDTLVHTRIYAPPEQVHKNKGKVDETSDIYSTAKTLFALINNSEPEEGQLLERPDAFEESDAHIKLFQVLKAATEEKQEKRPYKTAKEFKKVIESIKNDYLQEAIVKPPDWKVKFSRPLVYISLILLLFIPLLFFALPQRQTGIIKTLITSVFNFQDPIQAGLSYKKGLEYFETGDYSAAQKAFEIAVSKDNKNAEYLLLLGYTYSELKLGQKCITAFERAVVLAPDSVSFMINLGKAYSQFGQSDNAVKIWQKALKRDPANQTVRALIEHENKKMFSE